MIYFQLFIEFLKIGLFSIGGGLATLPFLNKLIDSKGWYTTDQLTNMLAISESTPGPIGVNMSTYVGFHTGGILGAFVATFALVLPSYIIIIILANFLEKFSQNKYVDGIFFTIRPVVTALIVVAFIDIFNIALFDTGLNIVKILLFLLLLFFTIKFKKHPIVYILVGGILGIVLKIL